jgi:hypothetical protein
MATSTALGKLGIRAITSALASVPNLEDARERALQHCSSAAGSAVQEGLSELSIAGTTIGELVIRVVGLSRGLWRHRSCEPGVVGARRN